jgi:hypothetical protein
VATAGPISAEAEFASQPARTAASTNVDTHPTHLPMPGSDTEYEPRLSSVPSIPPLESVTEYADPVVQVRDPTPVPDLSKEDPAAGLIALVNHLSSELALLHEEVAVRKTQENASKDMIEELRLIGSTYRRHVSLRHGRYQLSTSDKHHATYLVAKSFPSNHIMPHHRIATYPFNTSRYTKQARHLVTDSDHTLT